MTWIPLEKIQSQRKYHCGSSIQRVEKLLVEVFAKFFKSNEHWRIKLFSLKPLDVEKNKRRIRFNWMSNKRKKIQEEERWIIHSFVIRRLKSLRKLIKALSRKFFLWISLWIKLWIIFSARISIVCDAFSWKNTQSDTNTTSCKESNAVESVEEKDSDDDMEIWK